jgi:hypothetical protein
VLAQKRAVDVADLDTTDDKAVAKRKQEAEERVKMSRNCARLLVALCARAGEGRKRVVTELILCFEGRGDGGEMDMWCWMAWSELCLGLASPRSGGGGAGKEPEHNLSTLAFEVVRLMVNGGLVGCLMDSVVSLQLEHPLAPAAAGSLIKILEIFSRHSVNDNLLKLPVPKGAGGEEKKADDVMNVDVPEGVVRRASAGGFNDDGMIEEGFDQVRHTCERALGAACEGFYGRGVTPRHPELLLASAGHPNLAGTSAIELWRPRASGSSGGGFCGRGVLSRQPPRSPASAAAEQQPLFFFLLASLANSFALAGGGGGSGAGGLRGPHRGDHRHGRRRGGGRG